MDALGEFIKNHETLFAVIVTVLFMAAVFTWHELADRRRRGGA